MYVICYRKAGSIFCTCQGLSPDEVKSLSKHKVDIFRKSYCCEFCIPVLTTLAGFRYHNQKDQYWVPRALIGLPGNLTVDEVTNILFPKRLQWEQQFQSDHGDKDHSKGAEEFLYRILPFLATVAVQDGIFWINHFKRNPATVLLLSRLDGKVGNRHYSVWAREKRNWIRDRIRERELDEEAGANERRQLIAARVALERQVQTLNATCKRAFNIINEMQQVLKIPHANLPQAIPPQVEARQAVTVLRDFSSPRIVTVEPLNAYISLKLLVERGKAQNHEMVMKRISERKKIPKQWWSNPQQDRNRWSKIKVFYDRILLRVTESGGTESMVVAAGWLDLNERGGERSLAHYYTYLKQSLERYKGQQRTKKRKNGPLEERLDTEM